MDEAMVRRFLDWLYDVSAVWPDDVPREKLLALFLEWEREQA